jgi:hypothetical protein
LLLHHKVVMIMAKRGRPVQGATLIKTSTGSSLARERLKAIVRTLGNEWTVEQACSALGIGRSAFNKLRAQFLARATGLLEPRPAGRRPAEPAEDVQVTQLREENARLRIELHAHEIREEIAVAMPFLLRPRTSGGNGGDGVKKKVRLPSSVPARTPRRSGGSPA